MAPSDGTQTWESPVPATFLPRRYTDCEKALEKRLNITNYQKNANPNYKWDITSHQSQWPSSKGLQTINTEEGVEKRESSYTAGGNVNWCSHYGKQNGDSLKKLKIELPYDPTIPFLGIDSDKTIIQKVPCTLMFITVLFTRARTWKQTKCPWTDEWIKKMWHTDSIIFNLKK